MRLYKHISIFKCYVVCLLMVVFGGKYQCLNRRNDGNDYFRQ